MQAMDSVDLAVARGLPMSFRRFRERRAGGGAFETRDLAVPGEGSVVESMNGAPETVRP
jgi:hypothetical protein